MLPIKFPLNTTYGLGGDVVWRISRWPPSERNDFSNSESLCCSDASHQVLAQSNLRFRRRCHLMRSSWISERNDFSNSEPLCRSDASHQVSAQSDFWFGRRCRLKNFKMPSWISEWNNSSNSESQCHCDAFHQVLAQSDLWFGRRCRLKNFKMAGGHLRYSNGIMLAMLNLHVATIHPIKFQLNPTYDSGGDVKNVKS